MWGYESDEQFYEYAIRKVLEHKADDMDQIEFNKFKNLHAKRTDYVFVKKR